MPRQSHLEEGKARRRWARRRRIRHRAISNRGIAMVLVLSAVVVAFVVGMALMEGLASGTAVSGRQIQRDRAVYMAESGLVETIYRLRHPEEVGDIWEGVGHRMVGSESEYYSSTVTSLGGDQYRIQTTGHTQGTSGGDVSQQLLMDVQLGTGVGEFTLDCTAVFGGGGDVTQWMDIDGDIKSNGSVRVYGEVNGVVQAVGSVVNMVGGFLGGSSSGEDAVDMPEVKFDSYGHYYYNGRFYTAEVLSAADASLIFRNTLVPSYSANPLGVVIVDGDLNLTATTTIKDGILVVRGNIYVHGKDLNIEGREGYFSLLVGGDIWFGQNGDVDVKTGPVYLNGDVKTEWLVWNAGFDVHAGLVAEDMIGSQFVGDIDIENKPLDHADEGDVEVTRIRYFTDVENTVIPMKYTSKVE